MNWDFTVIFSPGHKNKSLLSFAEKEVNVIQCLMSIIAYEREQSCNQNSIFSTGKRYSIIDKHLARHSKRNGECLSIPPTFLFSQIITPFSHSMISTNQETGL